EGFGAGVKQVLERAGLRKEGTGNWERGTGTTSQRPWSLLRGIVADLLQAKVEHAAAIDVALGDMAQAVVIDGGVDELSAIAGRGSELGGRVTAVALGIGGYVQQIP